MPANAWLLGIANPQSIKRLGHFLTADCKSAGTPNGGKGISSATDISGATERHIRRWGTSSGGWAYPALWKSSVRHSNNFTYASPAAVALCEETTSERGGEALYIIASKIYFIDNVSPD